MVEVASNYMFRP